MAYQEDIELKVEALEEQLSHQQDAYQRSLDAIQAENARLKRYLSQLENEKAKNSMGCINCNTQQQQLNKLQRELEMYHQQVNEQVSKSKVQQGTLQNQNSTVNPYAKNMGVTRTAQQQSQLMRSSAMGTESVQPNVQSMNSQFVRHHDKPESTQIIKSEVYTGQRMISGRKTDTASRRIPDIGLE